MDAAWWGWRTPLGTLQSPQTAAAEDEVLYPWLRYVPGPKQCLLDLSLTATAFKGENDYSSLFSNWKWLCLCCSRGCSLAGSPGTTGNGHNRRCHRDVGISSRGRKRGKTHYLRARHKQLRVNPFVRVASDLFHSPVIKEPDLFIKANKPN